MGGSTKTKSTTDQKTTEASTQAVASNQSQVQDLTNTQQSGPSSFSAPAWTQAYSGAQSAYDLTPKTVGEIYAGPNALQTGALGNIVDWAKGPHPELSNVQGAINHLNAGYQPLDTTAALHAALNPYYQQLTEKILPQSRSAAIDQGAYDSPRGDITNGELIRDYWTNPVADKAAQFQLDEQRNQQQYALSAGPQLQSLSDFLMQSQLKNLGLVGEAGQTQQGWDQASLDAKAKAPWMGLGELTQILQALPSTGSIQTQKGTVSSANTGTTTGNTSGTQVGTGTQATSTPIGKDIFQGLLGAAMLFGGA